MLWHLQFHGESQIKSLKYKGLKWVRLCYFFCFFLQKGKWFFLGIVQDIFVPFIHHAAPWLAARPQSFIAQVRTNNEVSMSRCQFWWQFFPSSHCSARLAVPEMCSKLDRQLSSLSWVAQTRKQMPGKPKGKTRPAHSFLSKPKSYKIWQKITRLNAAHLPRGGKQQQSTAWGKTSNRKRKSEQGLELKLVKIWLGLDKWPARISSEKKVKRKRKTSRRLQFLAIIMSNLFNDDLHCGQNVNNETEKLEKLFFTCLFAGFFGGLCPPLLDNCSSFAVCGSADIWPKRSEWVSFWPVALSCTFFMVLIN